MQKKIVPKKPRSKAKKLKWDDVRSELYPKFIAAGITSCELRMEGVCEEWPLTFAHSLRRNDIDKLRKQGDWETYAQKMREVARLCQKCHSKVDSNKRDVSEEIILTVIRKRKVPVPK